MSELDDLVSREIHGAIAQVVKDRLVSYNSPLLKMVDDTVTAHSSEIKGLLKEAIAESIGRDEFRREVKSAFMHTLARSLMNEFKGEIEKQSNNLRQQADFRARVVLAIENIVDEMKK